MSRRVGIFSTLPIEVLLAAGRSPVDVNNLFVKHADPAALLRSADDAGLPRTLCAWTRGLYGATVAADLDEVVVVPGGDCTNNVGMAQLLADAGVTVREFHFPLVADPQLRRELLRDELGRFAARFGVTLRQAETQWEAVRDVRALLAEVDRLQGEEARLPGSVARLLLINSTDLGGHLGSFRKRLARGIEEARKRPVQTGSRVAIFGIPTIVDNLLETLEELGAHVAVCETERDFAMIPPAESLLQQYLDYAYPYGVQARLDKFLATLAARPVDRIVINAQSFCHHNLEMACVERALSRWPVLVLEADTPGPVSPRDRLRLEAFLFQRPRTGPAAPSPHVGPRSPVAATAVQVGLDLGSRFAKVVARTGNIERRFALDTMHFYRRLAQREDGILHVRLEAVLSRLGIDLPARGRCAVAATGYGRNLVSFGNARTVPELAAHAAGAARQVTALHFLLVDLGGQDTKAIRVLDGRVAEFVMNDKCAAGSGRYVENMARLLALEVEELLSHEADPAPLTNVCATFGESEVVGKVVEGVPVPRICAGIVASVAQRTRQLVTRLSTWQELPVFLAGGLADSRALAHQLSAELGGNPVQALPEPRYNGALGCLELLEE